MRLLTLLLFPLLGYVQGVCQKTKDITIGSSVQLFSKKLNSERTIIIYLPSSYSANTYTRYPVLYFLDGSKFFHPFTGAIAQLSSDASPQIPDMIVVGIVSQDRIRDSSPTNSLIGYSGKEEKGYEVSGGANNFLSFIRDELIPYIDGNYRTHPYRIFAGYSFTGLPVLHSLFTNPEAFNAYLVIDFSAWWDNQVTLKSALQFEKRYKGKRRDLFMTTIDIVPNDIYPNTENNGWEFIQKFEQNLSDSIMFAFKKYPHTDGVHFKLSWLSSGFKFGIYKFDNVIPLSIHVSYP